MDKKILLSGAAALVLGASLYAAPASASALSLTIEGEGAVTATMSDTCAAAAANAAANDGVAHASVLGLSYTAAADDANGDGDTADAGDAPDQIEDLIDAVTGGTSVLVEDEAADGDVTFVADPCAGASADNPVWGVETSWEWSAAGTLANGLEVTIKDGNEVELGGAFGTITFADGVDSAVKAAMVNGDGDIDVTGNNIGGHTTGTGGTAGVGLLWQAPSVGGVDLYVSYSPNSANSGLDSSEYTDTIGFGAAFATDMLTVSAGFESAEGGACGTGTSGEIDGISGFAGMNLKELADAVLGGEACGDESLVALGMEMSAGEFTINAGYSEMDTDGADTTVMNVGLSTSLGAYDLALDYVDSELDYQFIDGVVDTQTVIGAELSTALGDGVDLVMTFSTSDYEVAGAASESKYRAEAKLDISY